MKDFSNCIPNKKDFQDDRTGKDFGLFEGTQEKPSEIGNLKLK